PGEHLSAAEIAAAESVRMDTINPQTQTRVSWPDSPDVAEAWLDQLTRGEAIEAGLAARVRSAIQAWRDGQGSADAAALSEALGDAVSRASGRDKARLTSL